MDNINPLAIAAQRKVVDKFNKSKYPFYQIKTNTRHGFSMDAAWHMNGIHVRDEMKQMEQRYKHDVILFLDIDAIPLNEAAIDQYVVMAHDGFLVGNVQRSNHINNGQHLFVAPSAMGISVNTFCTIGKPSAIETHRADVAEEYTFKVEEAGYSPVFALPLRYESSPAECKEWALKDGMKGYGRQTTFGFTQMDTFWHNFQSFHPGQHEKFMAKCEEILNPTAAPAPITLTNDDFTLTVV